MRSIFASHRLTEDGLAKTARIGAAFDALLSEVEKETGIAPDSRGEGAREMALVCTNLETACHFAKKTIAIQARYQNNGPVAP